MRIEIIRRFLMPQTHEALPVDLIKTLICAAERPYLPAFGGDQEEVDKVLHAACAAKNVLKRKGVKFWPDL